MAARGLGDALAAQHSRDLLDPARLVERGDRRARGAAGHALVDDQMVGGVGRDRRQVRDAEHLAARRGPPELLADHVGDPPPDARVHLVEDQRRHVVGGGEDGLDGEHRARQLATGDDLGEGPELLAGIGRDQQLGASPRRAVRAATARRPSRAPPRPPAPGGGPPGRGSAPCRGRAPLSEPGAPAGPPPGRGVRTAVRLRRRPPRRASATSRASSAASASRRSRRSSASAIPARYAATAAASAPYFRLSMPSASSARVDLLEPLRDRTPPGRGASRRRSTASSTMRLGAVEGLRRRPARRDRAAPGPAGWRRRDRARSPPTGRPRRAPPWPRRGRATMRSACWSRWRSARSSSSSPSRGSTASISESWKR